MRGRKIEFQIVLTDDEFDELGRLARSTASPAGLVRRARVVLEVSQGASLTGAGRLVGLTLKHARKWCKRFAAAPPGERMSTLRDLPGRGRKPRFSPLGRVQCDQDCM